MPLVPREAREAPGRSAAAPLAALHPERPLPEPPQRRGWSSPVAPADTRGTGAPPSCSGSRGGRPDTPLQGRLPHLLWVQLPVAAGVLSGLGSRAWWAFGAYVASAVVYSDHHPNHSGEKRRKSAESLQILTSLVISFQKYSSPSSDSTSSQPGGSWLPAGSAMLDSAWNGRETAKRRRPF
eukprot:scaffold3469_cov246-Pinguiococcus_pyrenoidosus.AAC.1